MPSQRTNRAVKLVAILAAFLVTGFSSGMVGMVIGVRAGKASHSVNHPETGCPFSSPSSISRMTATIGVGQGKTRSFSIPRRCWENMLRDLSPSERELHPPAWQSLGVLTITTKQGEEYRITLFDTYERLGAFSAGAKYYRGGDTVKFALSLVDACCEATASGKQVE